MNASDHDDSKLRREIEPVLKDLLRAPNGFLEEPPLPGLITDPMIGKTIGSYFIEEPLGIGGMGVVYKARDLDLKRTVALKKLVSEHARDEDFQKRFLQEAEVLAKLNSPHIVRVYTIIKKDHGDFIVMEYVDGKTLKQKIEKNRDGDALRWEKALPIIKQVLEALSHAHKNNIFHRDIKPSNIMLLPDGVVKLVDFGIAKVKEVDLTKTGTTVGTVPYMSPEQAKGLEVDHRTDIWSLLGVVFYEMLVRARPFRGDYAQAIIYSIVNEDPKPILEDIAPGLKHIILTCLKKDVDERYKSAKDMLIALEGFEEEYAESVTKTVVRPGDRYRVAQALQEALKALLKKHRWRPMVLMAFLIVGLVVGLVQILPMLQTGSQPETIASGTPTDSAPAPTPLDSTAQNDEDTTQSATGNVDPQQHAEGLLTDEPINESQNTTPPVTDPGETTDVVIPEGIFADTLKTARSFYNNGLWKSAAEKFIKAIEYIDLTKVDRKIRSKLVAAKSHYKQGGYQEAAEQFYTAFKELYPN